MVSETHFNMNNIHIFNIKEIQYSIFISFFCCCCTVKRMILDIQLLEDSFSMLHHSNVPAIKTLIL